MRLLYTLSLALLCSLTMLTSCEKAQVFPASIYNCENPLADSILTHPSGAIYQSILDKNRNDGLVGAVLLVKDKDGLWIGSSGKADIASKVDMQPCNTFLVASISKVFTATAVFRYIDKGILSIEDPINKWVSPSVTGKIKNGDEAQIKHLLSHTSGIRDYYTDRFELDRVNRVKNGWTKEEVLEYVYGGNANFEVGETYGYSNTNYLLLSMILESASGLSFEEVYQREVFLPSQLESAYYSETNPIPGNCVRGYSDLNADGILVEAQNLYQDELGIGGDGGIAINAYDLSVFLEQLIKGQLISTNSLSQMMSWFDLPENWHWETYGQTENGYGLEKFNIGNSYAVGHTGGIDGFNSFAFYFPVEDMTYILLVNNTKAFNTSKNKIFEETIEVMFTP